MFLDLLKHLHACQGDKEFANVPSNPAKLVEGCCKTRALFQKEKISDVVSAHKIL